MMSGEHEDGLAVMSDQQQQILSLVLDDEDNDYLVKQNEKAAAALDRGGEDLVATATATATAVARSKEGGSSDQHYLQEKEKEQGKTPAVATNPNAVDNQAEAKKSYTLTGAVWTPIAHDANGEPKTIIDGVSSKEEGELIDPESPPPINLQRNSGVTTLEYRGPGAVAVGPGSSDSMLVWEEEAVAEFHQGGRSGSSVPEAPLSREEMAQARPVEEHGQVLHHAEPVPQGRRLRVPKVSPERAHAQKMGRILMIAAAISALALAITLGVIKSSDNDESKTTTPDIPSTASSANSSVSGNDAEQQTPSLDDKRDAIFQTLPLPNYTIDAILEDPSSPQHQAYSWLLEDPLLDDYTDDKKLQRFALATFYHSLQGEEWFLNDGWMNHTMNECNWFHRTSVDVSVNVWAYRERQLRQRRAMVESQNATNTTIVCDDEGRYLFLVFNNNNMKGTIPPEVELLPQLRLLDLSINEHMVGPIPAQIGNLQELRRFSVARNQHTGRIPTQVGHLTKLEQLYLEHNPVNGPIPSELGNLVDSLKILSLHRGGVTGFVPTELYQLTNLEEYLIQNNLGLTGGTLDGLGSMTSLKKFIVHDVPYHESLPSEFGLLTDMVQCNFWNTHMTGTIPTEFWHLTKMFRFDIDDNFFSGTFPQGLSNLSNLNTAWMNGNAFTGTIPSGIWQHLGQLTLFKLNGNHLTGTIPTEVGLLNSSMEDLWLNSMALNGTIPSELGSIKSLKNIFLHNTDLSGSIPQELEGLSSLEVITLSETALTGSIPTGLCSEVKDMNLTCLSVLGVEEQICTEVEVTNFSCSNSLLCGCSCRACADR